MNGVKFKIIYSLFVLAALLLLANTLITRKPQRRLPLKHTEEINDFSYDQKFLKVLSDWGLDNNWIKKVKVNSTKSASGFIYQIELPRDVTPDFILVDLRKIFDKKDEKVVAEDLVKRRKTLVKIFSSDNLMIEAFIRRNNLRKRELKLVTFCVDERDFNAEKVKADIELVTPLTFLFRPEKEVLKYVNEIREHKHSFAILLDDRISDGDFDLFSSEDRFVLKMAVEKLVNTFGKDIPYVYDNNSMFYKSVSFNYLRDKFKELYGISLLSLGRITDLTSKNHEDISSIVKIYLAGSGPNIFLIEDNQLESLRPLFSALWKKGIRFGLLGK